LARRRPEPEQDQRYGARRHVPDIGGSTSLTKPALVAARRLSMVYRQIALPHPSHHGLDGGPPTRTIGRVAVKYVDGSWATAAVQPVVRSRVTPLC
jgi:hypothetical protein